jgi:hypothetical protein
MGSTSGGLEARDPRAALAFVDILFDQLTATALRAGKVALVAIGVGELDGLTEEVALVGLFEREKAFAPTTTQHVDLGLGLRGFFCRLSAAGSRAHAALLLRGPVSGKPFARAGFTAALPRLESKPT